MDAPGGCDEGVNMRRIKLVVKCEDTFPYSGSLTGRVTTHFVPEADIRAALSYIKSILPDIPRQGTCVKIGGVEVVLEEEQEEDGRRESP